MKNTTNIGSIGRQNQTWRCARMMSFRLSEPTISRIETITSPSDTS